MEHYKFMKYENLKLQLKSSGTSLQTSWCWNAILDCGHPAVIPFLIVLKKKLIVNDFSIFWDRSDPERYNWWSNNCS